MRPLTSSMRHPAFPWLVAGGISLLLSLWRIMTLDVINPDGLCYLQSAMAVREQHTLAIHVCDQSSWPFYQVLIGGLSFLTGQSVSLAVALLDTALSLVSVLAFVAIVFQLTRQWSVRWLGIATILLAHNFNAFRADVIRDHGYWAFYLLSLYALLRFATAGDVLTRSRAAWGWSAALLVATLFRLEGFFFLLALPWCFLLNQKEPWLARFRAVFLLNRLLIVLLPLALVSWLAHPGHSLGRADYLLFEMRHGVASMITHWRGGAAGLQQHVLNVYSGRDAMLVLGLALSGYYLISLVDVLTIGYAALVLYAFCKRLGPARGQKAVLLAYITINFAVTAFFLAENFFLSRRYLMAMALTLMCWVPFAVQDLARQWRVRRWPLLLALVAVLVCAIGGIVSFGPSKKYIREAGEWLRVEAGPSASIYSNERVLLYYAGANSPTPGRDPWRDYDWVAIRMKRDEAAVSVPLPPTRVFGNARGSEVRIYRISQKGAS